MDKKTIRYAIECVEIGLDQIPLKGIKRLKKHLDQDLPVLMSGSIELDGVF